MSERRERPEAAPRAADGAGSPPVPPLPRRIDLEHAYRVYVAGRNRMWTEDEKRSAAASGDRRAAEPGGNGLEDAPAPAADSLRAGVPVPERLAFHRSAGTWRSAVPGGRRRPG
jgi:hypothetical protein